MNRCAEHKAVEASCCPYEFIYRIVVAASSVFGAEAAAEAACERLVPYPEMLCVYAAGIQGAFNFTQSCVCTASVMR